LSSLGKEVNSSLQVKKEREAFDYLIKDLKNNVIIIFSS